MGGLLSRRTGYFNPQRDLADLTGKVAIVTGANTGIGYHTVKLLARQGAKIYLGARNESKAKAAIAELEREGLGPGQVVWLHVDMSEPTWAQDAANEFLKKESRLDILVNNAAVLAGPYVLTKDGLNLTMVVNHFSPVVFIRTLLPLMIQTSKEPNSDVRIVTVGSCAHSMGQQQTQRLDSTEWKISIKNSQAISIRIGPVIASPSWHVPCSHVNSRRNWMTLRSPYSPFPFTPARSTPLPIVSNMLPWPRSSWVFSSCVPNLGHTTLALLLLHLWSKRTLLNTSTRISLPLVPLQS